MDKQDVSSFEDSVSYFCKAVLLQTKTAGMVAQNAMDMLNGKVPMFGADDFEVLINESGLVDPFNSRAEDINQRYADQLETAARIAFDDDF